MIGVGYGLRRLPDEAASEIVCRSCNEVVGVITDDGLRGRNDVNEQLTKIAYDHSVRCISVPQVVTRAALLAAGRRAFESSFPDRAAAFVSALEKVYSDAAQAEAALKQEREQVTVLESLMVGRDRLMEAIPRLPQTASHGHDDRGCVKCALAWIAWAKARLKRLG